jgi:hypothetical protein
MTAITHALGIIIIWGPIVQTITENYCLCLCCALKRTTGRRPRHQSLKTYLMYDYSIVIRMYAFEKLSQIFFRMKTLALADDIKSLRRGERCYNIRRVEPLTCSDEFESLKIIELDEQIERCICFSWYIII